MGGEWTFLSRCGDKETMCGNQLSPSITWVLGIKFWLSGLVAGAFTLGAMSFPTRTPTKHQQITEKPGSTLPHPHCSLAAQMRTSWGRNVRYS